MIPAISAEGLTKMYSSGLGCRGITLSVGQGEAFGFLGPNGAGKSTFVKMLVGLVRPSGGSAAILGHPVGSLEARRRIGYLPELFRYQEWLTGREVLELHAKLCGLKGSAAERRILQLLDAVGIGQRAGDRVKHYSKGMQQRLGLACALISDPPVVFLDEPASALDPLGRREVRELLIQLRREGKTVFLNTHLLEDVELLCDRVALLHQGEILHLGSVAGMLQEKTRWRFRVGGFLLSGLAELCRAADLPITLSEEGGEGGLESVWLEAEVESDEQLGWVNHQLMAHGLTLYEVVPAKNKLDEWFYGAVAGRAQGREQG
ncbi:ABC transporter ATP-binding protein [Paenibacillus mucilaginosus]|uniref:ABC transporter related protein n=1 Tax=Paenibacillus mucilaginosus (strain KNP414) TaxID=1036673 RepID=F8FBJ6_PAEMK|nr:ABC transporter ATP-binding protein [Paenibacillus mucilaginosus]AEI42563.1 ABC transporter related protein [Paenibacillus mucilaginosus KNP414]MCG7213954.1 ABC transporter ATP-binding protein [Paenibacillus mucilaginosus]WDM25956.1 ABC transporter ATP-binding protein [Paenibacillus mucilaginosus]